MAEIRAQGTRAGIQECVLVTDITGTPVIWVNGESEARSQGRFEALMKTCRPMGGTYFPPVGTMLAALSVVEQSWFDDTVNAEVNGDIGTIPYQDGVIY